MRIDEELLASAAERTSDAGPSLLIGGTAELAGSLAATGRVVSWLPLDAREVVDTPSGILVLNDPGTPLEPDGRYAEVIFPAPPERGLGRRWLVLARNHLAPGGRLLLAGANTSGIRSAIADGEALFGEPLREDYRSRHRVAIFELSARPAGDPAWALEPGIAEGTWAEVALDVDGTRLFLATLPGVFAGARLDAGTELLLGHLPVDPGERVLDVGCGAGAIGFALLRRGAGSVVMTDVNLLAVASVRETIRREGIADATAIATAGDVYSGLDAVACPTFDLIVSNPPFHQGKAVDFGMPQRLIAEAGRHLAADGRLAIVANAFLPYERLLEERFRSVSELANTRRFKVLQATRPKSEK